ncbi:MAG TPA: alpha/beta hydrolase [Ktedonosporobacter sp.]|nr:alpha/beta hydrolase [Ktedonosporobacter sp.]
MSTTSVYKTSEGERAVMAFYDSVLKRWPVPYETLNIATRHGDTFVIASGQPSAPPLVLLHGAGSNSAVWARDIVAYSHSYRTYAIDLLGEAGHSAENRPDWTSPAYAEWLDDVLNALKVEKAVLIGMSQGAWVALKYTTAKPERIEKLALISPGGVIPDRASFVFRALYYSLSGRWGAKRMVRMLYADQPISEGVGEMTTVLIRNFRARMGILPIFSDEQLQRLTMPTLLLGGTKDALRDIDKIAARLRMFVPQLDVVILPGAGHAVVNTAEHILPFLSPEEAIADLNK